MSLRKYVAFAAPALIVVVALVYVLFFSASRRSDSPVQTLNWPTMGTVAAVKLRNGTPPEICVPAVKSAFDEIQSRLNAHNPESEISRNAHLDADAAIAAAGESVRECYRVAFALEKQSAGVFNPRWRGKDTLDFGAIAKGFAVDLAAAALPADVDALIDLGGNLKAVGGSWRTGIAGSDTVVELTNGMACATSGEYFRGKHIYDGRTGLPVSNDVWSVTVIHPNSAMLADGLSTTLFVLGREQGDKFLAEHYPEATAVWIVKSKE